MNENTKVGCSVGNFFTVLKGYYLAGSLVKPIIKIVRCPMCNEPFFVKVSPFLNSSLLTTILYYGIVYDLVDEHLNEKHHHCLSMERDKFILNRTIFMLNSMYGRDDAQ